MRKVRQSLYLVLLCCLIGSSQVLYSQTLVYEGFLRGNKVGELTAQREVNDENVKIYVSTDIEAHMLFTIDVFLESQSTYIDQELKESSSLSKVNGNLKSSVQTVQHEDYYQIDKDGENKKLKESSVIGADIFYFEEPKNIDEAYSLALGEMMDVEKGEEPGVYFFEQDGKKEYHRYKNGKLAELKIDHALYTITFKIKQ